MNMLLAVMLSTLLLLLPCNSALATTANSAIAPGCAYEHIDINNPNYAGQVWQNPPAISAQNGTLDTTLEVTYGDMEIAGCQVHLRSYNGQLVGPTLRAKPGDTINLKLINNLPPESQQSHKLTRYEAPDGCVYDLPTTASNRPHNFNTTNFHTHGLHVDPGNCSDNVIRVMPPRQQDDNPAPEYSVKVHIPEDHPAGTFWYHAHLHGATALQVSSGMAGAIIVEGGLDNLPEIAQAKDQVFVLQQIAYNQQGQIEDYQEFIPGRWQQSQRRILINGQVVPVIKMHPGEVQRWRLIHAGVRESINLQLRQGHQPLKLHEIAVDGIALGKLDSWQTLELEPGYRSDVLIKAENLPRGQTSQVYDLIDAPSSPKQSLLGKGETGSILARVIVSGDWLDMALPSDRQIAAIKQQDAPPNIKDEELFATNPTQKVVFSIHQEPSGNYKFAVNNQAFNPHHERQLELNRAELWQLETDGAISPSDKHPFHIHVNSFQYDRLDPDHQPERIWRDTLIVNAGKPETIRTRYTEFPGKFVLHCHILDHEDQGMMEVVEILDDQPKSISTKTPDSSHS